MRKLIIIPLLLLANLCFAQYPFYQPSGIVVQKLFINNKPIGSSSDSVLVSRGGQLYITAPGTFSGGSLPTFTSQSIPFANSSGVLTQDNSNLNYNSSTTLLTANNLFTNHAGFGVAGSSSRVNIGGAVSTTDAAWTIGLGLNISAFTITNTTSSGTTSGDRYANLIVAPIISASSATTIPNMSTLDISAPALGTNMTFGAAYAITAHGGIRVTGTSSIAGYACLACNNVFTATGNTFPTATALSDNTTAANTKYVDDAVTAYKTAVATETNKTLTSPIINVGTDATGDMYYRNSSGVFTRLPIGSTSQVLSVSGSSIPSWTTPSSATGANPTATAGTAAVSGSATTFMRSDAAPAVDSTVFNTKANASVTYSRRLESFFTNVASTTSAADVYSYTIPANAMSATGSFIDGTYTGRLVVEATTANQIYIYFGGQLVFQTGTFNATGATGFTVTFRIYRTGSTTARIKGEYTDGNLTSPINQPITDITGVNFATTNILKAQVVSPTAGDITFNTGFYRLNP